MFNEHSYLYVEDDPYSRQVMQLIMQNAMGVERLTILEDSQEFLARAKSADKPDIIILDIHVRPYNGFEMLQMVRSDPDLSAATVIALTASVMNEEIEQLKQAGFDATIAKPLSVLTFPDLMRRVIGGEAVWHIS